MKTRSRQERELDLAQELSELWDDNEDTMGEQAAFSVACEQLGISEDRGYELLALLGTEEPSGELP